GRAHRLDELAGDGQAEARAGEVVILAGPGSLERLEEGRQDLGIDAAARVADGELDMGEAPRLGDDLDHTLVGELESVRRQVEEYPAQSDGVAQALVPR